MTNELDADLGLLILRVVVGLTFAAHGAQKVFGWWGGSGMERFSGGIAGRGVRAAPLFAWAAALTELVGGVLLAVGLFTSVASAFLTAQSVAIIVLAHWPKGFWMTNGGYEYGLTLLAAAVAFFLIGPGGYSIDALIGFGVTAPVALLVLLVAVGGASFAALTRRAPAQTS